MWLVFALDYLLRLNLYEYGLRPQEWSGLWGIITSPFLHSTRDVGHILNNSVPAFLLTWLLFYHYRKIATKSFLWILFLTGIGTWLIGQPSYHIGMSGVIYGLTGFLVISGFLRKTMRVAAISLFVVFIYGSLIWGVFPVQVGVSWEGHLSGLIAGILVAIVYREQGPQSEKLRYELEEEMGIEPELEYWREDFVPPAPPPVQVHQPKITIHYTFVPTKKAEEEEE